MKIDFLIKYVRDIRQGTPFADDTFLVWINELEADIQLQIFLLNVEDIKDHTEVTEEVCGDSGHTAVYTSYLLAMLDLANGEMNRYNDDFAIFKKNFSEYACWYADRYHPADGLAEVSGYYISAYSLAVKHGFSGSEEEWITAVEANRIASETAKTEAEASAQSALNSKDAAEAAKKAAETSETNAKASANLAATSATNAKASENTAKEIVSDFNTNIADRTQAFNDNAEAKTISFNNNAAEKQTEVDESANAAALSKTEAAKSATEAATSASVALSAKTGAETAQSKAETAQASAEDAKDTAISNASSASISSQTAMKKAEFATAKANEASASADAAATAQGLAENAQASAEGAKTGAETAKADALSAKSGAETARKLAEDAQTAAETARDQAQQIVGGDFATKTEAQSLANTAEQNAKNYADGLSSNYEAAGDAEKVQTNLNVHKSDSVKHITAEERTTWNNKADSNHTHDYNDLQNIPESFKPSEHTHSFNSIENRPESYPPSSHTHPYIPTVDKNKAGGVAGLNKDGKVFEEQLPEMLSGVTATIPIADGQTLNVYDVVNLINGKAKKEIKNNFASPYTFYDARSDYLGAVTLNENKIAVAYVKDAHGYVKIGTISGSSISFGITNQFIDYCFDFSITALSESKIAIAYNTAVFPGGYDKARVIIGTVSGSSISFGSSITYLDGDSQGNVIESIGSNKFVVGYSSSDEDGKGKIIAGTVSGTSITLGSTLTFNNSRVQEISISKLQYNKFIIAFHNIGSVVNGGIARIGTVSYSDISLGNFYTFDPKGYGVSTAVLNENKVVIASASSYGKAVVGTINNKEITFGDIKEFVSSNTYGISATKLSDDKVAFSYRNSDNNNYGIIIAGTIRGRDIEFSPSIVFFPNYIKGSRNLYLKNNKVALVYKDNNYIGKTIIADLDINLSKEAIVTNIGSTNCDIIYSGITNVHGLTKGTKIQVSKSSVLGYVPIDGKLVVQGFWERS